MVSLPTLGKTIAMAYVKRGNHKMGTAVGVVVRGKRRTVTVVKVLFCSKQGLEANGGDGTR